MTTNVQKWGNSQGIRIPRHILEAAKLSLNEEVRVTATEEGILIRKIEKPKKNIRELFEGYSGNFKETDKEVDWGAPVGKEIW